jgi:peptidoglycan hydrolase-like protein with peptidoglycan-binding domain
MMLGNVAQRRVLMMAELAKAGLKHPAQQFAKSMTYGATKQLVDPSKAAVADSRDRILEKWVQAALNVALGLRLKSDGQWGGDTRAAIMRFQREEGLHAHGFLDDKTLQALEERIGMRAPRDGRLQGPPRLWQQDRLERERMPQRPGKPPDKPGEHKTADGKQNPAQERAQRVLEQEAMAALTQVAFSRAWVQETHAAPKDKTAEPLAADAALQARMLAWCQQVQAQPEPPAWLAEVRDLAQGRQAAAAEKLREAWLQAHPEGK